MALYMYDADSDNGKSVCYGSCATLWPPLSAGSNPISVAGRLSHDPKTIQRTDGILQVVYNGRPLYYYSGDNSTYPTGQAIKDTQGQWWLLKLDGTSDETTSAESASDVRSDASSLLSDAQSDLDDDRNNLNKNPTDGDAALRSIADSQAVALANAVLDAATNVNIPVGNATLVAPVVTNP